MLKPKTKLPPATTAPSRKKARITSGTEVEVIEDDDSLHAGRSITISPASSFQVSYLVPSGPVQSSFLDPFSNNQDRDQFTIVLYSAKLGLDCFRPVNCGP